MNRGVILKIPKRRLTEDEIELMKRMRTEQNLTGAEIADALGVVPATVYRHTAQALAEFNSEKAAFETEQQRVREGELRKANRQKVISDEQVAEIRRRAAEGESTRKLGLAFGVSNTHVSRIVRGVCRGAKETK